MKLLLVIAFASAASALVPKLPMTWCHGKTAGLWPDPFDCRAFVMCHMQMPWPHMMICPATFYFHPKLKICMKAAVTFCKKTTPDIVRPSVVEEKLLFPMKKPISCTFRGVPAMPTAAAWLPNGFTYFFKGMYYYKYHHGLAKVMRGYPKRIIRGFPGCPVNPDAALYVPFTGLYFFKGTKYCKYVYKKPVKCYPINSHWKKLPFNIDAAFYWPYTKKIYFFKGTRYWRFTYKHGIKYPDAGFPKFITSGWKHMPTKVNTVVAMPHGKLFFIKKNFFVEYESPKCHFMTPFSDERIDLDDESRLPTASTIKDDWDIEDKQVHEVLEDTKESMSTFDRNTPKEEEY